MAGALAREGEGERANRAVAGVARQPLRVVNSGDHFARPQPGQHLATALLGDAEHHALATATREHAEDQPRPLGCAAVDAAPHLERPVPAMNFGGPALGKLEVGLPDQGAIAEDPEVFMPAPFLERLLEHGCWVA